MSWSLQSKCHTCKKLPGCSDLNIISGAIGTIHSLGNEKAHLGAGTVAMDCMNFEDRESNNKS